MESRSRTRFPTCARIATHAVTTATTELGELLDALDLADDCVAYWRALFLKVSPVPDASPVSVEQGDEGSVPVSPPDTGTTSPHDGPWLYRCDPNSIRRGGL